MTSLFASKRKGLGAKVEAVDCLDLVERTFHLITPKTYQRNSPSISICKKMPPGHSWTD